jgi:hypothetical protein
MKATLLAAALAVAFAAPAFAHTHVGDCGVHSDYSLSIKPDKLVFHRKHGTPVDVEIANGTLRVDGALVATSTADAERLRNAEREVRAVVPEVKGIARDAIAIAFDAIGQVAAAFAPDGAAARASAERLSRAGRELDQRLATSDTFDDWQESDVDHLVEETIGSVMPEIIGNVTAQAMKAALTGDASAAADLEARANSIDKSVDRAVEKQSGALEKRAEALCPRLRALEQVQQDLNVRLAGGSRLDLVRVN